MTSKIGAVITQTFKSLAAEIGQMKELNGDTEFEQTKSLQTFLGNHNIAFRGKRGVNDLVLLDSNMGNIKKAIAKDLQQNGTTDWAARLPKVVKGFNKTAHQSPLNETPDEVYHKGEPQNKKTPSSRSANRWADVSPPKTA